MNRRTLLKTALGGAAFLSLPAMPVVAAPARALTIGSRSLDVNGRAATVYSLLDANGKPGLAFDAGDSFDVSLANTLGEETIIHWHGLEPPFQQDGVPNFPMPPLKAGETRDYSFPVGPGGTYWMHAHTLQEQNLLAAPLIVRTTEDRTTDEQEVVILLHDFSFRPAAELLAGLTGRATTGSGAMTGMNHAAGTMAGMAMGGMAMTHGGSTGSMPMRGMTQGMMGGMTMDLNDIDYDAYLANDRTLDDPEVVRVEKGGRVRLRIINAASATNFTIDLGALSGQLMAVDGHALKPISGRSFPLAMAQRLDIRLTLPREGGAFPVLALREGARQRTGIVLASLGAPVSRIAATGDTDAPVLDLALEARLAAAAPLQNRPVDRSFSVPLTGDMAAYSWGMNGGENLHVRKGERIEVTLGNMTMMAHPMHLHGHHFQVVAIDGRRFSGALRDTVLIPPMRSVTFAVDADNPGQWMFHCHHLYHMVSGMMVQFVYQDA